MNRWILRGLATAGFAAGAWMLTAAPAQADSGTEHHPTATARATLADIDLLKVRIGTVAVNHPRRGGTGSDRSTSSATVRIRTAAHRPGDSSPLTARGATRGNAGADRTGRNRTAHQDHPTARPDRGVRVVTSAAVATDARVTPGPVTAHVCALLTVGASGTGCGGDPATGPAPVPEVEAVVTGTVGGTPTDEPNAAGAPVLDACLSLAIGGNAGSCGTTNDDGTGTVSTSGATVVDACVNLTVGGNPGTCGTATEGNGGGNGDGDGDGTGTPGTDGSGAAADNGIDGTDLGVRTVVRTADSTVATVTAPVTAGLVGALGAGGGLLPRTGAGGVALLLAGLLLLLLGAALLVTGRRRLT